eukprot:CAMPEP_0117483770 /NCGR_PEP_ID=MMETSP0784-20121206/14113_1 /TAXON_ID=39447 /ORGANISM="" /LENGTH=288 /DNA_ID=CAMNT_0005278321 /DNA_START=116 /DNA_END=979 /DNA_ORIENTATION=-
MALSLCIKLLGGAALFFAQLAESRAIPAGEAISIGAEERDRQKQQDLAEQSVNQRVLRLNDKIFHANVLREEDPYVRDWFVYFCPSWWEPCQTLMQPYMELSREFENSLNADAVVNLRVRFAWVDCATDKPLCNEMGVQDYPTVQHFSKGKFDQAWRGRGKKMAQSLKHFVQTRLEGDGAAKAEAEAMATSAWAHLSQYAVPGDRAVDVVVVVMLLIVNFYAVSRNPDLWRTSSRQPVKSAPLVPAAAPSPEHPCEAEAEGSAESQSEAEGSAESQPDSIQSVLPDEW